MSEDDAGDEVKITKGKSLVMPFSIAGAAVLFLVGSGWKANGFLTDIRQENRATREAVETLRLEIKTSSNYRWTISDMERWAFLLDRNNRDLKLAVPDPRTVRPIN